MSKEDSIEVEGKVIETLPSARFKVELENGHEVICYLSGKLRENYIKIISGDLVRVAFSPYDMNTGRIIWRGIPSKDSRSNSEISY